MYTYPSFSQSDFKSRFGPWATKKKSMPIAKILHLKNILNSFMFRSKPTLTFSTILGSFVPLTPKLRVGRRLLNVSYDRRNKPIHPRSYTCCRIEWLSSTGHSLMSSSSVYSRPTFLFTPDVLECRPPLRSKCLLKSQRLKYFLRSFGRVSDNRKCFK